MVVTSTTWPTLEEFDRELGPPVLSFSMDQHDVQVPTEPPHCCRRVHQPYCGYHVAKTVIRCEFEILLPDGERDVRQPLPQTFDGDIMARPVEFGAAIQTVTILARSTADGVGGVLTRLVHSVWTLNLEQAAIWKYLTEQRDQAYDELLQQGDSTTGAWIESLGIAELDTTNIDAVARIMGKPDFRHVRTYARQVMVLPHEIGHDMDRRYVASILGGEPGAVPPSVEAILRDPFEDNEG